MSTIQSLKLKKLTLSAWANHLLSKGMITIEKHRKMMAEIQKLSC